MFRWFCSLRHTLQLSHLRYHFWGGLFKTPLIIGATIWAWSVIDLKRFSDKKRGIEHSRAKDSGSYRKTSWTVLAQLVERLLTVNCIEKTKIKKKEAGNGPSLKRHPQKSVTWRRLSVGSIFYFLHPEISDRALSCVRTFRRRWTFKKDPKNIFSHYTFLNSK